MHAQRDVFKWGPDIHINRDRYGKIRLASTLDWSDLAKLLHSIMIRNLFRESRVIIWLAGLLLTNSDASLQHARFQVVSYDTTIPSDKISERTVCNSVEECATSCLENYNCQLFAFDEKGICLFSYSHLTQYEATNNSVVFEVGFLLF